MSVPLGTSLVMDGVTGAIGVGASSLPLVGNGLQGLLGFAFVVSGAVKLVGADEMVENFRRAGYPQWFRVVTGLVETTGGLALLGGVVASALTSIGVTLLGATMLGAIYTQVVRVDTPFSETAKPTALLVLVATTVLLR